MGERDETRMSRLKKQKQLKIWSILTMSMEEGEEVEEKVVMVDGLWDEKMKQTTEERACSQGA